MSYWKPLLTMYLIDDHTEYQLATMDPMVATGMLVRPNTDFCNALPCASLCLVSFVLPTANTLCASGHWSRFMALVGPLTL